MASTFSISGVGSGIDFNTIRDAILASRSRPITQLQTKVGVYNSRIESLKQLNTNLASFTSAAQALTNRDLGTGRSASSGDSNVATASANSTAALGQIDLSVTRLATNLSQASRSFSSVNQTILAGGATSATFELRKGGAATGTAITIDSSNNTLAGLRDAINAANAGVTASIVDLRGDGTEQQLVLNSKETGAAGRIELVETSSTGTAADLNLRSLNPPDGDFAKLDAALTVNNLPITRSTNTVSDAVSGVTLTLKKTGTTSVNVNASTEISDKLRAFVNSYNAIQEFVAGQYKKDGKGRPTGALAGETTLQNAQRQLRESIGAASENNGGTFKSLAEIGITAGEDGKLSLDSTVLSDKLKTNAEDVRALLFGKTSTQKGIFQNVQAIAENLSNTTTGSIQTAINGYQSSIQNINDTITNRLEIINRMRETMTKQFAAADSAIGLLNSQSSSITNILKSLQKSDS